MKFLFNILNSSQVEWFKPHEIAIVQNKSNLGLIFPPSNQEKTWEKKYRHFSPVSIETIVNLSNSRSD